MKSICSNATAPINIIQNVPPCDLKCEYSFTYPKTNLVARNNGDYILFTPTETGNTAPVIYNANKYTVQGMRLYQPSLHTYGGVKQEGELIIDHTPLDGGNRLLVCVPVIKGSGTLDELVANVAKLAPIEGSSTGQINMPSFSFGDLVPMKPFYSYTGTLPYNPCNGTYDYIVFNYADGAQISSKNYIILKKIISANVYKTQTPPPPCDGCSILFYNSAGPTTGTGEEDIYINCEPTGSDGEVLVTQNDSKGDGSEKAIAFLSSHYKTITKIIQFILGVILVCILWKVGLFIFDKISGKTDTGGDGTATQGYGG